MTLRWPTSPLWFVAPLVAAYAAAFFIVELLPHADAPGAVATGLTIDLVILLPALYYVIFVRGRKWPAVTIAPVVLLSFSAASLLLPTEHHAPINAIGYALPVIELGLLGYVGYKAWHVVRANREASTSKGDFYDRIRETLRGAFDVPAVVGVLAYEVSLFHYAFSLRRPETPRHGFTYHRANGYRTLFAAFLLIAAVELIGVHILLQMWSTTAALIHVVISLYGIFWLVGDFRAMSQRPHELRDDRLRVRCGLRWDLDAAWSHVACVRKTRRPTPGDDYLSTVLMTSPQYVVELQEPVEAVGPYGVTRDVQRIGIVVDDAAAFEARLRSLNVRVVR